jgi:hypothetical protein
MRLGRRVEQLDAGRRERDQRPAPVARIRIAGDQAGLLEPVQALGRAAGREHHGVGQLRGPEAVGRSRAAQRRQDVVPAALQSVLAVDGLEPLLELAGEPRDAPDHADRRGIEVGPLAAPLLEDQVHAVPFGHGAGP